jgi:type VI secretion system secreted protein Hcp
MDVLILDPGSTITGECALTGYVGKIELLSYSHGIAQQITGDQSNTKRTSGKPNHQDFTVTKYQDLSSCNLMNCCNTATPLPSVIITVGQNDNGAVTPTWVYTLTNALISSVSVGGGGGGKPQETVTFNYTAISWVYKQQAATAASDPGNNKASWNLATNATT